jgi:hypothetical protein
VEQKLKRSSTLGAQHWVPLKIESKYEAAKEIKIKEKLVKTVRKQGQQSSN